MKKIQNFYLYSYRVVGFIVLSGLIASIIWYGFSILFFITNSSWSVPMILSPNQEKVMIHLEHVLALEQEISKNRAEMLATKKVLLHKKDLLAVNQQLLQRINQSIDYQSVQYDKASKVFKNLSQEKKSNLFQLNKLSANVEKEESLVDEELNLGLITKQEALAVHLSWNKLQSNLIDLKASMYDLKKKAKSYAEAANTLTGSGSDVKSINQIIKKVGLEGQIDQLQTDIEALQIVAKQLKTNILEKMRVLKLIKHSPYILATKKATTVAFVPYTNLKKIKIGAPTYSCYLDMLFCYKSGYVFSIYNAEEYNKHPIFKSELKGQLVGIHFDNKLDGQKKLLFINSKPLLI